MIKRITIYLLGTLILALGITFATQAGLGISPILALAYLAARLTELTFPITTFLIYLLFVIIQLVIYLYKHWRQGLLKLFAQIIVSLLFSSLLGVFLSLIPNFSILAIESIWSTLPVRIIILIIGTILTGIGASMMLMVELIPTPADGIVQTISEAFKIPLGTVKNALDITLVTLTLIFGMIFLQSFYGIGIGTLLSMVAVGRVMALFNQKLALSIENFIQN